MNASSSTLNFPTIVISTNDDSLTYPISNNQGWAGRTVSVISKGFSTAGNGVVSVFQSVLLGFNSIASDPNATAGVFRKLDHHVLKFFEHLSGAKGSLSAFSTFLKRNVTFIDFTQIAADIYYFACGKFKEIKNEKGEIVKPGDHTLVITGKAAAFSANIGGALLWLEEMSFISLSKAATSIGEVRVFNFVPKIISSIPSLSRFSTLQTLAKTMGEFRVFSFVKNFSCLFVTLRALDLAFALFAVDAGRRLVNASNAAQVISAGLDLSSYLAELTLSAIVFAGVTNVVGLGIAGSTCIVLAAASFLYRTTHDREIKQEFQPSV